MQGLFQQLQPSLVQGLFKQLQEVNVQYYAPTFQLVHLQALMYSMGRQVSDLVGLTYIWGVPPAATVATYCPSRMVEHPQFKSLYPE